jgi:signal transduction histidine kinase/FixJ family two-component response regulator
MYYTLYGTMKKKTVFCSPDRRIRATVLMVFMAVFLIYRLDGELRQRHILIAQFLMQFCVNTEWIDENKFEYFHILLITDDNLLFQYLKEQTDNKVLRKIPLKVSRADSLKTPKGIHLIYVGKDKEDAVPGILESIKGKEALLVTDNYPNLDSSMINIFDTPNSKVQYELNKTNLEKQKIKIRSKLFVYARDREKLATMFQETQDNLAAKENKILELQQQLDSLNKKIQQSKNEFKIKEDKIAGLQVEITNLQKLLNSQKTELRQQQENLRKQQETMIEQTRKSKSQKTLIEIQKDQIKGHNKTLRAQEEKIKEQIREIQTREATLKQQGATISTQKNVLYLMGTVTFLVFALIITIFRGYRNKQRANRRLEEKRDKLQQTLDMLRFTKNQLEVAKNAAEAANRAKSEFLSNMSHELRTPLNSILGYSQLIRRRASCSDSDLKGLDIILNSGNHLLRLINEILDLSKVEAGKMDIQYSNFSLPNLLKDIIDIMNIQAQKKGIQFKHEFTGDLPQYVSGDPKRLDQVLLNLLGNAFKFTDKGSVSFTVSWLKESTSTEPAQKTSSSRKRIRFMVSDTGPGIPKEKHEEIFSAFTQVGDTERKSGGTGLGLTISRELVQLMGGQLQVTSKLNKGSSFWFDLLMKETSGHEEIAGTDYSKVTGYKGKKRTILVVDDSSANRLFLSDLLQYIGFDVYTAVNGKDGLEKVREHDPDLILLDLAMPEMNGLQMVEIIRNTPELKDKYVILVSASTSGSMQLECLQKGFDSFIPKPVKEKHLFDNLECFLHLEWIYDHKGNNYHYTDETPDLKETEITETKFIPPSKDLMEKIYIHAKLYDYEGLGNTLTDIEQSDRRFFPFTKKIRKLADDFLMPEICDMIDNIKSNKDVEEM